MRLAADAHRADFHFGRIEFELRQAVENRGDGMRGGAGDTARLEVERDLQLDVLDIDDAVARPLRFDVVGLKRPPDAVGERAEGGFIGEVICHRETIEKARLMHDRNVGEPSHLAQCRL